MYILTSLQTFTDMFNYMIALTPCTWFIEEAKIGTTLGALFGGLLLGVVLSSVVLVIIYRRSKSNVNKRSVVSIRYSVKLCFILIHLYDWHIHLRFVWGFLREEPNVGFADNNRYSLAKIVDHGTFQNIQTKDKKVMTHIMYLYI